VGIITSIFDQVIAKAGVGYQYEEFLNEAFRNRFESIIGLEYRF
jgi:hypothetical protein